jgi:hypothetical protein
MISNPLCILGIIKGESPVFGKIILSKLGGDFDLGRSYKWKSGRGRSSNSCCSNDLEKVTASTDLIVLFEYIERNIRLALDIYWRKLHERSSTDSIFFFNILI